MNLQPTHRRQDLPVRLGNHGYRFDGDFAVLEADLHIPPHCSGSDFGLELWACSSPHAGGSVLGTKVAEVALELPTPIAPHLHRVEARTAASIPSGDRDHAMVLMLVSGGDARRVHDFANYGRLQHFASPSLDGAVGYGVEGDQLVLRAEAVSNPRSEGNSSGTLCLELWALAEPYAGGVPSGHRLGGAELGSVWGQHRLPSIERRAPFTPPVPGRWHLALLLREWTLAQGYVTRDYRNFDVVYDQADPERAAASVAAAAPAVVAPAAGPRPVEKLRLIKPAPEAAAAAVAEPASSEPRASVAESAEVAVAAEVPVAVAAEIPVAAPAPAAGKPAPLSLQRASIEELSKLPGVSLKVAKEIVKGRPYASLDALLQVRGIGEKTLRRIKSLLTL